MKLPVFALAIALTLGAMAAFMALRWTSTPQSSGAKVVIVEKPIEAGKAIKTDQIKTIDWPAPEVPQDASTSTTSVLGRIARVSMIPGELVLSAKLAPKNATGGLSSIIEKGKRAITVQVNEVVAVAGFALPGSYVDILVSGKDDNNQPFSRTVLSRVKVLAVAQETTSEPDKPKVVNAVTLELTPHESEKLDLARNIGTLSLVLRNELDTSEVNSAGVRLPEIVYPAGAATPKPAAQNATSPQSNGTVEIRGMSH
ncbi:MAG: Flp pilus assembly protein CpaB [Chlorobiaceae bacterium]|nr:Flp pilus assembly protein CpaB [Chlorobiaceae bacterium]